MHLYFRNNDTVVGKWRSKTNSGAKRPPSSSAFLFLIFMFLCCCRQCCFCADEKIIIIESELQSSNKNRLLRGSISSSSSPSSSDEEKITDYENNDKVPRMYDDNNNNSNGSSHNHFRQQQQCQFKYNNFEEVFEETNARAHCYGRLSWNMPKKYRRLMKGEYLCSPNFKYVFGLTLDGMFALCRVIGGDTSDSHRINRVATQMVWRYGPFYVDSDDHDDLYVELQIDGNLIIYDDEDNKEIFNSGTYIPQSYLQLYDSGAVEIRTPLSALVWTIVTPQEPGNSNHYSSTTTSSSSTAVTYKPGKLVYNPELNLFISEGLEGRLIATSDEFVNLSNKKKSKQKFHLQPDGASCFDHSGHFSTSGKPGYYYVSNAEIKIKNKGGVGRIEFDHKGNVLGYEMLLENQTENNCGNGKTPWETFITCEEVRPLEVKLDDDKYAYKDGGHCYEVDPRKFYPTKRTVFGGEDGDRFESMAFDSRYMFKNDVNTLAAFATVDLNNGRIHRYRADPQIIKQALLNDGRDFSDILTTPNTGQIDYLHILRYVSFGGDDDEEGAGHFEWTTDSSKARESAKEYFPSTEGIDCFDGFLYFVSKKKELLFILDLDKQTFITQSTRSGLFQGQPDQVKRLISPSQQYEIFFPDINMNNNYHNNNNSNEELIYFLEDGGSSKRDLVMGAGVHARDSKGNYFTIAQGDNTLTDETTGLAFCDEGKRLIFAFQDEGKLYELTRSDGYPFYGHSLDVTYHSPTQDK